MQPEDHYIYLYEKLPAEYRRSEVSVTLAALAELLCCTTRNTVFLLRKWESAGWATWRPGSGRSRRSRLHLLISPEDLLFARSCKDFDSGHLERAFSSLSTSAAAERRFAAWLSQRMGYRLEAAERGGRRVIEESLHFSFYRAAGPLDPAFAVRQTEYHLIGQLFDPLLLPAADGSATAHIAHAWEHSEDYTRWTFYLRKGVLFHDGSELTARDAAFTLKRLRSSDTASPHRHWYSNLSRIKMDGPYKLKIETSVPEPLLADILAFPSSSIVREDALHAPPFSGSGPYVLTHRSTNGLTIKAFDHYFLGRPHLDKVVMWVLADFGSIPGADQIGFVPFREKSTDSRKKEFELSREKLELKFLVFNFKKNGPQLSREFRSKAARLIREREPARALGGNRQPLEGLYRISGSAPDLIKLDHSHKETALIFRLPEVDQTAAEPLRVHPSYSEPGCCPLRLSSYDMPLHAEDLEWVGEQLGRGGIDCESGILPFGQWTLFDEPADLLLGSIVLHPSPELSKLALLSELSGVLQNVLAEPQLEALNAEVAEIRSEPEPQARRRRLDGIMEELERAGVWLPLYTTFQHTVYDSRLQDVRLSPYAFPDYRTMWLRG
ncbi:ABC transporter substrate-binding protein [Saccharibacillus deserti]|uniref:ABC transporter substrate-binding protein n=1 Tax=Saccharibacillus deserti TaxID=1634444 RepID=UPI0015573F07